MEAQDSELMDAVRNPGFLAINQDGYFRAVFDNSSQFGVSMAQQAAVVDVSTAHESDVVVDDHHLRMDVDLLGGGLTVG